MSENADLKKAYRTLQLEPGASLKEIVEARDDLLYLWDPERLAGRPRVRSRAQTQRLEIQAAAKVLLENLSGSQKILDSRTDTGATSDRPSLYEEVFSREPKSLSGLSLALLTGLGLVVVMALFMFLNREPEAEIPAEPALSEEPGSGQPPADQPSNASALETKEETPNSSPDPAEVATQTPEQTHSQIPATAPQQPSASPSPTPEPQTIGTSRPRSTSGSRPALLRGPAAAEKPPTPPTDPSPPTTPVTISAETGQEAFDLLLEQSRAARMLASGRLADLTFDGWNILEKQGDEIYLDIPIQKRGTTVHFVWGVNTVKKTARALSQAARDLEAGTGN